MKRFSDRLRPARVYIVRKNAVGSELPAAGGAVGAGVEVNDLRQSVHAGIRSPGTGCFDRFVCHFRQRVFYNALNADTVTLALPAVVGRAIVLETECNPKGFALDAYAYPGSASSSC